MSIPLDKVERAVNLITDLLGQRKTTVKNLQHLCGFLNFLCKCIVPGRAFTRRLYTFYSTTMKPFHHIRVSTEMKEDLRVWLKFLESPEVYCRLFLDYSLVMVADRLNWFTDASGKIGVGGICGRQWFQVHWPVKFLDCKPSIEFLELYGIAISVLLWTRNFRNRCICLFCDNQSVVQMINTSSSSCKMCMKLIRLNLSETMKWM